MKTTIIFDLWETLGTKNVGISKSLQERFNIPKSDGFMEEYEKSVQIQKWENEEEMAKSFLLAFNIEQSEENISFVTNLFRKGISNATLFDGVKDILILLKQKGYKLALLSNTTIFESDVLKRLKIDTLFDVAVFSWQKGNLKPSPEAFDHVLSSLNISKEQAIFIDDTKKNITKAQEYGIQSIKFESVNLLVEELKQLHVL